MLKLLALALLLTCALGTSSCATTGQAVKPNASPTLPPLVPPLSNPPETAKKVQDELFKRQPSATSK